MARPLIHLHFRTFPEDHLWVGECIELDVCTSADTQQDAIKGAEEATQLYLRTIAEEGQLTRILAERGIPVFMEGDEPQDHMEERTVVVPIAVA